MGEPAELSALDVTRVRQWAQALVDAVTNDEFSGWRELLTNAIEERTGEPGVEVGANETAMRCSRDDVLMAQLERAQVIVDSVSRAALIEKLEAEQFQEDPAHGEHENAVRHGWNLGRQSLLRELKDGRL